MENFNKKLIALIRKMDEDPKYAVKLIETILTDPLAGIEDHETILSAADRLESIPERFDVRLVGFTADKKIPAMKVIRHLTGLGLLESKNMTEGYHDPLLLENVTEEEANLKIQSAYQAANVVPGTIQYAFDPVD